MNLVHVVAAVADDALAVTDVDWLLSWRLLFVDYSSLLVSVSVVAVVVVVVATAAVHVCFMSHQKTTCL